jgi:peptidoglycan/LPS O-acetylase OafA/YrhL
MSSSFYWGLSKPGFILGLMLTLLPTILGHRHSFFNLVLTSKAFHFIARISFCTYLVHLMVLYQYTLTRNYNIYFNITEAFVAYLGMLVVSLFLGFWLTVLVELPCAKLQRELMQFVKGKRAPPKEKALSEQLLGPEEMKNSLSTSISKSIMTQD